MSIGDKAEQFHQKGEGSTRIDWDKPLFNQICVTEDYWALMDQQPAAPLKRPATLFQNPLLEALSRTHWYMVPAVWVPVAARLCMECVGMRCDECTGMRCLVFLFGFLSWTLLEYTFHRFIFHHRFKWLGPKWGRRVHFLIHGVHHLLPHDNLRLVFPPLLTTPVFATILVLLRTLFGVQRKVIANLLAAGLLIGYVTYDLVHFWIHHARSPSVKYLKEMKRHHMHHHFRNSHVHFGITCKVWDRVFHTLELSCNHGSSSVGSDVSRSIVPGPRGI